MDKKVEKDGDVGTRNRDKTRLAKKWLAGMVRIKKTKEQGAKRKRWKLRIDGRMERWQRKINRATNE